MEFKSNFSSFKFVLADFLTKIKTPNVKNIVSEPGEIPLKKWKKISWPQIIRNVEKITVHTYLSKNQKNKTLPWNLHFGFFGVELPQISLPGKIKSSV